MDINQLINDFTALGNTLSFSITKIIKELQEYKQIQQTNKQLLQTLPILSNSKDLNELKNEIKNGETIFDQLQESLLRNENILT